MRVYQRKVDTMSLTYSIDHLSTSVEDVSVEVATKSIMTLQSTSTDPKTGEVTSVYVLASGDNAYPATVTYRSALQTRGGKPVRRLSMTLSTWATKSDSVSGLDTKEELTSTYVMIVPANMTIEVADADDLIGNTFSFLYLSVTAKVRDTTWLQNLIYGIPQVK
jgi:hypothetical protein